MHNGWHVYHIRKRTPFFVSTYTEGFGYSKKRFLDFDYHVPIYFINGHIAEKQDDFEALRRRTLIRLKKEPSFLLTLFQQHYALGEKVVRLWKSIGRLRLHHRSNQEIALLLQRYADSMSDFWSVGLVSLHVENEITNEVESFIASKQNVSDTLRSTKLLMQPIKPGVVWEEERSLLRVAVLPPPKKETALKRHHKKYAWLANQLYTNTFFPLSYFRNRLRKYERAHPEQALNTLENDRKRFLAERAQLIKELNPPKAIAAAIETLQEAMYHRSWRGELPYQSGYLVALLLREAAKRLNLTMDQVVYCLPRELVQWLRNNTKVRLTAIRDRQKAYVYLPTERGTIKTGLAVKNWEKRLQQSLTSSGSLRGQCAYPGVVEGPVTVVTGVKDISKVNRGDILVAQSTTPLHLPALQKVVGIITDEGGILSHASVIAREMEIPTIIGAANATTFLKTDDRVRLDSKRGIIKKL